MAVFRSLRHRATKDSLPVYLVGGPVRDAILEMPVNDLDFTLLGDAPALAAELAKELGGEATVHSRFGTATVTVNGDRVDIVTARKEVYPYPGSLPEVSVSGLENDLARRDFSINAMALSVSGDNPQVIDPHGGLRDLAVGSIRTLHPGSFADDPTRMLRAVRYEQRLGFQITDATLGEITDAISSGHADAVTGDRWRQELVKIFEEDLAAGMLLRAVEIGVLPAVHPALVGGQELNRLAAEKPSATERLGAMDYVAALAVSLSAADGDGVIRQLNFPAAWARLVRDTIALKELDSAISGPSVKPSAVCRALEGLGLDAIAATARISADQQSAGRLRRYLTEWRLIESILTGDDLLAMGVLRGPSIGQVLRELVSAKQDGLLGSEEEERALVNQIISRGS